MKIQRALLTAVAVAALSIPIGAGSAVAGGHYGHGYGHGHDDPPAPTATLIASGLQGTIGGAIGPDGALYVPESGLGQITRVDPETGATSVFASGLPIGPAASGGGGVIDVAFAGHRTYALVSLVGSDIGGTDIDGVYQLRHDGTWKVIADLGAYSAAHPPATVFDLPNGLQYAFEAYRGGFIVSDGNHNRLLRVNDRGRISVLAAFENIVPTGLALGRSEVHVAEAGPAPHDPSTGKVVGVSLNRWASTRDVASGVGFLVDVELNRHSLYALSIGQPTDEASMDAAVPNTGSIVRAARDGTFTPVIGGLNLPTSIHFTDDGTILVVTLTGEVWRVES